MPDYSNRSSVESTESKLLAEIDSLKERLHDQEVRLRSTPAAAHGRRKPSGAVLAAIGIVVVVLIVIAFFVGFLPGRERQQSLAAETKNRVEAVPSVNVEKVVMSDRRSQLVLPGNIQAVTEAPLLARASGYVKTRSVDIGDRVKAGQLLAVIEAPEVGQQVQQAQAGIEQANSALEQASANLIQGRTNAKLAQITSERYQNLVTRGAVSKQEADTYLAQFDAQTASVQALEKAVNAARSNVRVGEANLARLREMQGYLQVRAPFAGVITMRNVDVGALVTEGSTLLYRVAQIDRLRTFINVPQSDAAQVHTGQRAFLLLPDLPNRKFEGKVTRTASSLDPTSRTLLTEVQAPNTTGELLPGMYAEVDLATARQDPPLLIPSDTLIVRATGPQVAIINPDQTVHFQKIALGRDYGDKVEVLSGLKVGQEVIVNPGDRVVEGVKVKPVIVEKPRKS